MQKEFLLCKLQGAATHRCVAVKFVSRIFTICYSKLIRKATIWYFRGKLSQPEIAQSAGTQTNRISGAFLKDLKRNFLLIVKQIDRDYTYLAGMRTMHVKTVHI